MSVVFFKLDRQQDLDPDLVNGLSGHRIGVVTPEPRDKVRALLKKRKLDDRVEFIVADGENWYEQAVTQTGADPEQILYVNADRASLLRAEMYGIRGVVDPLQVPAALSLPPINISGLAACTADARDAALDGDAGPDNETNFQRMLQRLEASKVRLPPLYLGAAQEPFAATLETLGPSGFTDVLVNEADSTGLLLLDISHSIIQNGERFQDTATDAFEEVVTDLYDGFLSAQDRKGIKQPDRAVLPPLVKWGNPADGPYTWPIDATSSFGVQCAVVNLPPANAAGGIMAWAALGHETAGHDILHADHGLEAELAQAVHDKLLALDSGLAAYWSQRIDETASDVMGILNMGPAPAIGMISFFRGLIDASGHGPHLRTSGPASDPHPADILRGYLGAATVRHLSFAGASDWAKVIDAETEKDARPTFNIAGRSIAKAKAKQSAQIVAETIATFKTNVLNNHALIEIQDWRNEDEAIVQQLIPVLTSTAPLPAGITGAGVYAAHVVAASVMAALAKKGTPAAIFKRMIATLKSMHDLNPAWGPMRVLHPSSLYRDFAYRMH